MITIKKIIYILIVLVVLGAIYFIYNEYNPKNNTDNQEINIVPEENTSSINKLYIYGTHLNLFGNITLDDINYKTIELVLINKTTKKIDCLFEKNEENKTINYKISPIINKSLFLDDIDFGTNSFFIKVEYQDKTKYFPLKNTTEYDNLTYYTLSKYNKTILINNNNQYKTLSLNVSENKDNNYYDIVIDPGHGGKDPGASNDNGTVEKTITLDVSKILKEKLENFGLKVKMTREDDTYLQKYGDNGRIDNMVSSKAKYGFSIHLNSHNSKNMHGVELYTANNIDYTLAKSIVDNIVKETKIDYSNNLGYKKYNGVYTRQWTKSEINNSTEKFPLKTTDSAYYFIIRETGGIVTGAYVDGSMDPNNFNKHYNNPIGLETYIIELGYIINNNDLDIVKNNLEKFAIAIANSIKTETNY